MLNVMHPIKTRLFVVPTIRKKAPMGATPHKVVTNRFPQVGENQHSEALGPVFDPIPKGEGVETPSPKTNQKPPSVHQ